jgi:cell division protein FtsZ
MSKISYASSKVKIKVVGCGGGGCNAITRMVRAQIHGVEFIAINTDAQHLAITEATNRIQIGEGITRGMGAGGDHLVGRRSAEETKEEIKEALYGADMVFVAAGMGGGSGTGSAPIVAEVAKHSGALTIGIVTLPFAFEGARRMKVAEEGVEELAKCVDTLIVVPNDKLLAMADQKTAVNGAFAMADNILQQGVRAITEVLMAPGLINLDFADIKAIMKDSGPAWLSVGEASGSSRAKDAAREALSSPLLSTSLKGARGVLYHIAGGNNLTLFEVNDAAEEIKKGVDPDANIIFGVIIDPNMDKEVRLTLIATGLEEGEGFGSQRADKKEAKIMQTLKATNPDNLDVPAYTRYQRPGTSKNRPSGK